MADELDPGLEAKLRAALHHEADSIPLLVRSHDLERARRRRARRRLALPASLLGLAAVLAIALVAGGVIERLGGINVAASPPPSAAATDRPLVDYATLAGMLGIATPDLEGEQPESGPAGGPVTVDLGTLAATSTVRYAIHCLGGTVTITVDDGGGDPSTMQSECAIQPMIVNVPGSVRPLRITAAASPAVRWRIVVVGTAESPDPASELASINELKAMLQDAAPAMAVVAGGERVGSTGTEPLTLDAGVIGPYTSLTMAVDCRGAAEVEIWISKGDRSGFDQLTPCGSGPQLAFDRSGSAEQVNQILVTGDPSAVWRLVVAGEGMPGGPGLRTYADLAAGADSTIELGRAELTADGSAKRTILAGQALGTDLELAISCDTGSVGVTFLARGVPVDTSTSVGCGNDSAGILLNPSLHGTTDELAIALDTAGLTSWRAILYDHGRNRKPALVAPVTAGPSTLIGAVHGQSHTGEETTLEGDVAPGSRLAVTIACRGTGQLHVTVDGVTQDAACEPATILVFDPPLRRHTRLVVTQDGPVSVRLEFRALAP